MNELTTTEMEKEIENVREITLNLLAKTCQLPEDDGEN